MNDTWFGSDGFNFNGQNVSFPYYWVIIRSDKPLDSNAVPQPIFRAVQTARLDSVIASSLSAAAAASTSAAAASLSSLAAAHSTQSLSSSSTRNPSSSATAGNVQHASSSGSFPRWAIAVIVVLGFLAIAATCILAFLILRRIRRRQQQASSRNSMGSSSPMMPRDNNPDMIQRYDSAGSPLLPPATLGGGSAFVGGAAASGAGTSHDNASTISDSGGPFSGADAAIMADAFRKMLRKPDFAANPVEETELPDKDQLEEHDEDAGDAVLRDQLAEEGRDIRSVSSSRGVKVETQSHEQHEQDPR